MIAFDRKEGCEAMALFPRAFGVWAVIFCTSLLLVVAGCDRSPADEPAPATPSKNSERAQAGWQMESGSANEVSGECPEDLARKSVDEMHSRLGEADVVKQQFRDMLSELEQFTPLSDACIGSLNQMMEILPPAVRELDEQWVDRLMAGEGNHTARLARSLSLYDRNWDHERLVALFTREELEPVFRELVILDLGRNFNLREEGAAALAGNPAVRNVRRLNLERARIGNEGLSSIVRSPHLSLRSLDLQGNSINSAGLRYLGSDGSSLSQLENLELGHQFFEIRDLQPVIESPGFPRLNHLSLDGITSRDSADMEVFESEKFNTLESLSLDGSRIRDEHLQILANSPTMQKLTSLSLERSFIGSGGLTALADSKHISKLESLNLLQNGVRADGLEAFIDSSNFRHLQSLSLGHNEFENEGLEVLSRAKKLNSLVRLDLSYTFISWERLGIFFRSDLAQQLEWLNLAGSRIGSPEGAIPLDPDLTYSLRYLHMGHNNLGDQGLEDLIAAIAPLLESVRTLNLSRNSISDDGVNILARAQPLPNLKVLILQKNNITLEGVEILMKISSEWNLEKLSIRWTDLEQGEVGHARKIAEDYGFQGEFLVEPQLESREPLFTPSDLKTQ